ncbi:MAG: ABC transporter ATP-binding protein [Chloroflexi bacterium]|nr:ABC transporter ATP-binding protein [Chloroflexota bacterium]
MPVALDHVWKRYKRGARETFWSLSDVSLAVGQGESVGLIGANGAGKSTTLKLLAGITRPTHGTVTAEGRVASLINLGAGFHRELTGRENVLLNGVILGLTRAEVRARFQQIVDFAELGAYLDTPVKHYSSGMYARLGFAVAAHVDPDVLLVDEVLSVGDVGFQERSIRTMLDFRDRGCSILFVSHNLSAVEMMCQRTIWLDHGQVRLAGPTAAVVRAYLDTVDDQLVDESRLADPQHAEELVALEETSLLDRNGEPRSAFESDEPCRVRVHCGVGGVVRELSCRVTVRGDYGPLFSACSQALSRAEPGRYAFECAFDQLPLLPGLYRVDVELRYAGREPWLLPRTAAAFRVTTPLEAFGSSSVVGATKSRGGFLAVPYAWRLDTERGSQALAGIHRPDASNPA